MKISPMNAPLERPTLEEIKESPELSKADVQAAVGGFIILDSVYEVIENVVRKKCKCGLHR